MQFVEKVYSWISQKKGESTDGLSSLSNHRIIQLADEINYLFMEMDTELVLVKPDLELPQIVVVGTQSSGKSSVLNRIMNLDLLPTGSTMVTRTPLYIRMHHHSIEKEVFIEMKEKDSFGKTFTVSKIQFSYPTPTKLEIETVRNYIHRKTIEYAGEDMNISNKPIILDIYSPDVVNLCLVDLPGMLMIAQPDKGQPVDITKQIEKIVSKYINRKKVIILAVIQARKDLETDQGLAFIKKYASDKRIVGVLTKPDLMNKDSDVSNYLTNKISTSLQLSEGYFIVKNSIDLNLSPFDNTIHEKEYFTSHPIYSKKTYENRTGVSQLKTHLSQILLSSICESMPKVLNEIMRLDNLVQKQLIQLGEPTPTTQDAKLSYLHNFINSFTRSIFSLLEDRGLAVSAGKKIKDVFINFRIKTHKFSPFDSLDEYPDAYFKNLIENFDGNHMTFSVPHVEVLECCMTDHEKRPILMLNELSKDCINEIYDVLVSTIKLTTKDSKYKRYNLLCQTVEDILINKLLSIQKEKTMIKILDHLNTEESYIWSDDHDFKKVLQEITKKPVTVSSDFSHVRTFVNAYYETVKTTFSNITPKITMDMMVRVLEKNSNQILYEELVGKKQIDLFKDDSDIEKQRLYYDDLNNKIKTIKKTLEEADSL